MRANFKSTFSTAEPEQKRNLRCEAQLLLPDIKPRPHIISARVDVSLSLPSLFPSLDPLSISPESTTPTWSSSTACSSSSAPSVVGFAVGVKLEVVVDDDDEIRRRGLQIPILCSNRVSPWLSPRKPKLYSPRFVPGLQNPRSKPGTFNLRLESALAVVELAPVNQQPSNSASSLSSSNQPLIQNFLSAGKRPDAASNAFGRKRPDGAECCRAGFAVDRDAVANPLVGSIVDDRAGFGGSLENGAVEAVLGVFSLVASETRTKSKLDGFGSGVEMAVVGHGDGVWGPVAVAGPSVYTKDSVGGVGHGTGYAGNGAEAEVVRRRWLVPSQCGVLVQALRERLS
uniref:Uncharacterized protein n=1 Tax=Mycena chlorophos TaxID=658473 RepID=A0ABQ0LFM2_MYCCL|nr:predicted protein [Mycena chlorophos]